MNIATFSLPVIIGFFLAAALIICLAGFRLANVADELADRTGLGEVIAGALFIGAATSLPGAITSVWAGWQGVPDLAIGNALGGLTVQTAWIALADLFYRRANLEHAAASVTGLAQGTLFVILLSLPLLAAAETDLFTEWRLHPVSVAIPVIYLLGLRMLWKIKQSPMWEPIQTRETEKEVSEVSDVDGRLSVLWFQFAGLATLTGLAGFVVAQASLGLIEKTGLDGGLVGTLFSAVASSLPELVIAIAAVRIGAVSLAVGNIIGGNAFDVMFLAGADAAFETSIYAEMSGDQAATAIIAMTMTGVLLLGMLAREKDGPGGIGFESVSVLALYGLSVLLILV